MGACLQDCQTALKLRRVQISVTVHYETFKKVASFFHIESIRIQLCCIQVQLSLCAELASFECLGSRRIGWETWTSVSASQRSADRMTRDHISMDFHVIFSIKSSLRVWIPLIDKGIF